LLRNSASIRAWSWAALSWPGPSSAISEPLLADSLACADFSPVRRLAMTQSSVSVILVTR
jgi:hypothetical protein